MTKERPILFTPENAQKVHDGRKTQTRRIVKPQPPYKCEYVINGASSHALCRSTDQPIKWVPPTPLSVDHRLPCPFGTLGDRLWVREKWHPVKNYGQANGMKYVLFPDGGQKYSDGTYCPNTIKEYAPGAWDNIKFKPSIHMPRWACRTVLELTEVWVERLQAISPDDARAEGCDDDMCAKGAFTELWESINGAGSWDLNPWVWVLTFKKVEG